MSIRKPLWIGIAVLLALSGAASAADLPLKPAPPARSTAPAKPAATTTRGAERDLPGMVGWMPHLPAAVERRDRVLECRHRLRPERRTMRAALS